MEFRHAICAALALLALLPAVALAQEDPEAVYAKLHRAALAGKSDEVLEFATARQKADLGSKSQAEKDAVIQLMAKLMPRTYSVTGKTIAPDGQSALMRGTGVGEFMGKSQMYLDARFRKEAGVWKVDQWSWSSTKPAASMAQAAPEPKAAAPASKPAAPAASAPILRIAEPECVYKPVMTNDDMKACGIGTR